MSRNGNAKGMKETKFKDTELGKIPEDWDVCNLGSIGVPLMCKRIMKWQTNETAGVPFYKIGTFGKQADAFIAPDIWRYMITHFNYPRKGDILISSAGTIGRTVVFDGQPSYFQDSNIVWINNDEEKVLNPYLEYAYTKVAWSTDASTISRLYNSNLKSALILFPHDKDEQQRIASALSDADALVAELDALTEKKRAIMAGTMQELLTGKRRLQGFSEPWSEEVLRNHLSFLPGFPFTSDKFSKVACGPRLIRNRDLHSDDQVIYYTGEYSNQYIIENGDLLIGMDGDFTPCLWEKGNAVLNQRVGRIICKNTANIVFLYYLLQKPLAELQESTGATTVKHLSHSTIENMVCRVPKLAEQRAIASILSDMDAEIAELEAKRDKYKEVRQGMMQQLLTGKIRLI